LATGDNGQLSDTNQLQAARHFLSELDKIAGRQRTTISQSELALEQQRVSWMEAKRRLVAIDNLRSKRQDASMRAAEKYYQRELDELYSIKKNFSDRNG
jgi:flagellar export protein FliJ